MLDFRLFTGEHICLVPLDLENDPPVMAAWTEDSAWIRACDLYVIE
jgi:hypothetical protein